MIKLNYSILLNLVILSLLCSPSYSLVYIFTGIYIANEKIAFLICICLFLIGSKAVKLPPKLEKFTIASVYLLIVLLILVSVRYLVTGVPISVTNINYLISFVETCIFSIVFFNHGLIYFLKSLVVVIYLQIICSSIQIVMTLSGNSLMTSYFTNHYSKSDYQIPLSVISIPRPFGLFNEASELSAFFAISLILLGILYFNSRNLYYLRFNFKDLSVPIIVSFIGMILTFSTTGIIMLAAAYLSLLSKQFISVLSLRLSRLSLLASFSLFILYLFFNKSFSELLITTFTSSARSQHTVQTFDDIIYNYSDYQLFLGSSAVWEGATWDIISRTIQVYGLIGFAFVGTYLLFINFPLNTFSFVFLMFLLSNASPASSSFMFVMSLTIIFPIWFKSILPSRISL